MANAPGPRGLPYFGSLFKLRNDPIGFLARTQAEYGDIFRLRLGPELMHVISHPRYVQHVFQDHYKNYGKRTRAWKHFRAVVGTGLISSEGDFWLRQRRIAQPAFHRERIAAFAATMTQATQQQLLSWDQRELIELADEMMRLTLDIIGKTMLGTELSADAEVVGTAVACVLRHTNRRFRTLIDIPAAVPTPNNREFSRALRSLDEIVYRMIAQRRRAGHSGANDLLAMLMEAHDEESGERMNDQQLRDEVMTMFIAGHETTANALTWTFYLLAQHSDIRTRLELELQTVLGGRVPELKDVPALQYTERVIKEAMRLYPPVWAIGRSVTQDDTLGGYLIPQGSIVLASPYLTHRHPDFWAEPTRFDPDRFLPERSAELPRYTYFPFGGGPRQCIGNLFAMMEAQLILACIAQRYHLDLLPQHPVVLEPMITLRPRYGMRMSLTPRS